MRGICMIRMMEEENAARPHAALRRFFLSCRSCTSWRCCIIQQSDKSLGIKQLTTTESTEHAEKRDKTARFAPLWALRSLWWRLIMSMLGRNELCNNAAWRSKSCETRIRKMYKVEATPPMCGMRYSHTLVFGIVRVWGMRCWPIEESEFPLDLSEEGWNLNRFHIRN